MTEKTVSVREIAQALGITQQAADKRLAGRYDEGGMTKMEKCGTCVCFCEDGPGAEFGVCISRRHPILCRKPTKRATDAACNAYQFWERKDQQTGSEDGARQG